MLGFFFVMDSFTHHNKLISLNDKRKKGCVSSPSISSKEAAGRLVVQRELPGAVAGHADTREAQQDGHARHDGALAALQHGLGRLGLKERAGVTTDARAATTTTTTTDRRRRRRHPRPRLRGVPPGNGGLRKEVTLVAHLPHPGDGFTVRKEPN